MWVIRTKTYIMLNIDHCLSCFVHVHGHKNRGNNKKRFIKLSECERPVYLLEGMCKRNIFGQVILPCNTRYIYSPWKKRGIAIYSYGSTRAESTCIHAEILEIYIYTVMIGKKPFLFQIFKLKFMVYRLHI